MTLEGAAPKCGAAASKVTALTQGEPLGADGYSGQQGGEAARPNRLCRLPSLLAAMGGRGILREGSLTFYNQPIAGSQLGRAVALEGAAPKCGAAASKVTALPQGEPLGADGYSGQQGGEAARPNRLCRLPSLLAAMGGRGILREGLHTIESSEQPAKT